ncbi:MAG: MotA/TolQ/ExbB proton channel family protein [Xanthobacteraceae bacterium]|jgi:biopolymer transport protein ExbB/TolQ
METAATALTPFGLFLQAGLVAKIVILLLLAASIWCWVLIIEGAWSIARLKRAVRAARSGDRNASTELLVPVVEAGRRAESLAIPGESVGEARTRVADAMSRAAQSLLARIEGGLPNLAVISSVAPFIGLFGTVWGIMVSFSAIADAKDTSLAVVAPGIAEALAATAIGLAAAIPATIGYNRLGASLARAGQDLQHVIEEDAITITAHRSGPARSAVEVR